MDEVLLKPRPIPKSKASPKRILLLTDWVVKNDDWSFLRAMRSLGYHCQVVGMNLPRKYNKKIQKVILLWPGYLIIGLKGFLKSHSVDVVIAYQGVAGLFFSLFKILSLRRKPKLVLMTFFFRKRKNKFYDRLRYTFTKFTLRAIDGVICYSRKEAGYYNQLFGCKAPKFYFVPFGINFARTQEMISERIESQSYIFSAGTSNRDYRTLFEAVAGLDTRVVVVTKKFNVRGLTVPQNVEIKFDIYGHEFYELMRKCRFVVVTLQDERISSGQLVLLESMALGKAVIATKTWGTEDYLIDNVNALLVPLRDSQTLRRRIQELLTDVEKCRVLGQNARQTVQNKFTIQHLAKNVSDLIQDL